MLIPFEGKSPQVAEDVFIAPNAVLVGDVHVESGASVWFGAVLRADHGTIVIGAGSSIQDQALLHVPQGSFTIVGEDVTVGHGAILEGCHIARRSVVGVNALVLAGAEIGEEVMIAAGSVVPDGAQIPARVLVAGAPARIKKPLEGSALNWIGRAAPVYHNLRARYLAQGIDQLPREDPKLRSE